MKTVPPIKKKYDNVIKQVSDFQSKLVSLKLNAFGSIYFNNDLKDGNEKEFVKEDIYDGKLIRIYKTDGKLGHPWKDVSGDINLTWIFINK